MKTQQQMSTVLLFIALFASKSALSQTSANTTPPVLCYMQAISEHNLYLDPEDALTLCHGATSADAPILCFVDAVGELGLDFDLAILLCSKARQSRMPINCYREAMALSDYALSDFDAIYLCSPIEP